MASSLHLSLLSVSLLDLASGPQKGQAAPAHRRTEGLGRRRYRRRLPRRRRGRPRPGGRYPCYSQDQLVHEGNLVGASKDDGKLFKLTHRLGDEALLFRILRHFRSNKYMLRIPPLQDEVSVGKVHMWQNERLETS